MERRNKTKRLVLLAMFTAIIILMAFTPLGYLKVGPISITFLTIPVVIGAITLGPSAGAFLGAVFGATSFIQCFGMDWFGTTLFGINPFYTFIMCMLPRVLIGVAAAFVYRGISGIDRLAKLDKKGLFACGAASFAGAAVNTVGFVGLMVLFFASGIFGNGGAFFDAMIAGGVVSEASIGAIIAVLITLNALLEAVVCLIVGAAVSYAIDSVFLRRKG